MTTTLTPAPSPNPDSPYTPRWMPSQFKGIKKAAARKNSQLADSSLGETIANAVSGGVGAVLAIAALVVLIVMAALHGGGVRVLAAIAFGVPLLLAFLMSTLYHALPGDVPKLVFRILGHDFIFLVIAGAFTPYCVLALNQMPTAQIVLAAEWIGACVGIVIESVWISRPRWIPAVLCAALVVVGLVLLAPALYVALPAAGWWLLVVALICFALALAFTLLRKVPYLLFVAHIMALAGAVCLFLSVVLFVI